MEPAAEIPPNAAGQGRSKADRIPVETGRESDSVQRVSGSGPGKAEASHENISQKSRQNRPVPENQAFHGQVKKSESRESGQKIRQKISAQNGSSSKGYVR